MAGHDVHRDGMENDPTIAAFALDLQDAAAATPAPAVGASLAAVLDGRAPTAVYPELVLPGRVRPARRSLRLRWAVASAAFGIGAGSLGIAGALPGPVQRQVSRMAEVVGVDLPDGRPATTTTTITLPTPTTLPPATTVPQRAAVEPADERPTPPPTDVEDEDENRGRDDRGKPGAEPDEDELESRGPDGDDDDLGSGPDVSEDGDRGGNGPGGDGEDEGDEDRSGKASDDDEADRADDEDGSVQDRDVDGVEDDDPAEDLEP